MVHYPIARYWKTNCQVISDELQLKYIGEHFRRQSDSCSGLGEEICDAPHPPCHRKQSALSLFLTRFALLSSTEVTMTSSMSQGHSHKIMFLPP
jgi:hypothetical protein